MDHPGSNPTWSILLGREWLKLVDAVERHKSQTISIRPDSGGPRIRVTRTNKEPAEIVLVQAGNTDKHVHFKDSDTTITDLDESYARAANRYV